MKGSACLEKSVPASAGAEQSVAREATELGNDRPIQSRTIPLVLLVLLLVFAPLSEGGTTHLAVMAIRLLIIGLAVSCLPMLAREGVPRMRNVPWLAPALAFLGVASLSTIMSPTIHQSRQWWVVLVLYAVLFYFIVFSLTRWKDVWGVLGVLIAMGLAESVWALVQYGVLKQVRPSGTFFNPNFLAGYLAAIGVMTLAVGLFAKKGGAPVPFLSSSAPTRYEGRFFVLGGRFSWGQTVLWAAAVSCLLVAIMVTGSRGGVMALFAGVAFVLVGRYRRRGLALLICVILGVLLLPNPLRSRLEVEHSVNPVTYARINIWTQALRIMTDQPLGVGLGLYQYVYPRWAFPVEGEIVRYGKVAQTPHNEYLQIGVELGVPGILLFCWGLARVAREGLTALRTRMRRLNRGVVVGIGGAAVSLLVHAAVDSNLHEPAIALLLVFSLASLCSIRTLAQSQRVANTPAPWRVPTAWLIGGASAFVLLGVLAIQTGMAWWYFDRGNHAQRQGQLEAAIDHYRTAAELDSDKPLYHSSLAAAHFQRFRQTGQGNDAQSAADELLDAIARNPLDGRLQGLLGHLYATLADAVMVGEEAVPQRQRLRGKAIEAYEAARNLEPFVAMHRLELGRLYWAMGERQRGIDEVVGAETLEPNFLPARAWLVQAYLASDRAGDRQQAQREFREILDRRQRYAAVPKNSLESIYLTVDMAGLRALMERGGGPLS